jgi:UDP-N-acetylmuramoyl-tripeptide--D-alanyl-D-alanine ligase
VGEYNLPNVLATVTVGKTFNVAENKIISAIENYRSSNSRSQLITVGTNQVILDAYNANPSSMKLAIENFAKLHAGKKIMILGGMAELGDESLHEHQAIADLIKNYSWEQVALVGGDFLKIQHPFLSFENSSAAKRWWQEQKIETAHVLIKGSRSMQMEKILGN